MLFERPILFSQGIDHNAAMSILFLVGQPPYPSDTNLVRLSIAATEAGMEIAWGLIDTLELRNRSVSVLGERMPVIHQDGLFEPKRRLTLTDFNTLWVLSLGRRSTFLDKIQILNLVPQERFINNCHALVHLNSKYSLAALPKSIQQPERLASANPDSMKQVLQHKAEWMMKPAAESQGRGVYQLSSEDPNTHSILDHEIPPGLRAFRLIESRVKEIEQGEKRVLIAGGTFIGAYLRRAQQDHRTNLATGAAAEQTRLNENEQQICHMVAEHCESQGARFIGIDLVYPYVIEINVINPGGIGTLIKLGEGDQAQRVIHSLALHNP